MNSVLLVDDNPEIREVVRNALDIVDQEYEVYDAENGEEAIDVLMTTDIDVMVLDLEMPVTNGWETLRIVRDGENGWPDMKVIVCTVQKEPENAVKAWSMEVDHFISKPFRLSELVSTIQEAV